MTTFVTAAAACCCLAACGGAPQPKALPTDPPSPSPTVRTPTPPAMPTAAEANTRAGAEAFVRHYVALINYAQATGDTAALQKVEARHCISCSRGRAYIDHVYSSGGTITGGAWKGHVLFVGRNAQLGGWTVDAVVRFGPQTIKTKAPDRTQRLKGGQLPISVQVSHARDTWKVEQWSRGR